jgi:NADH dehydrogenase
LKVCVIGGTGFVGSYIVDRLVCAGHTPRLLVRPGSAARVEHPDRCETVEGDVRDQAALTEAIAGADAVVYLVGLLRELPAHGITFEEMHLRGVERGILAALDQSVRRFVLMSANGVRPDGTAYQRTKYQGEQALRASGLDWTIFRPSVIFGEPRGRMEFCTQLKREIIDSALPAPLFYPGLLPLRAGRFELAPVSVDDVAEAFAQSLARPETIGHSFQLCGPEPLTWKQILTTIASAVGKTKLMLPVSALALKTAATLFDRQPWFPVTRDQLTMLMAGNTCDEPGAFGLFGINPRRFDVHSLAYLRAV